MYLMMKFEDLRVITADDKTNGSGELASLAENFREQAAMLVDMLDISIPMVAKLKVKTCIHSSSLCLWSPQSVE